MNKSDFCIICEKKIGEDWLQGNIAVDRYIFSFAFGTCIDTFYFLNLAISSLASVLFMYDIQKTDFVLLLFVLSLQNTCIPCITCAVVIMLSVIAV